MRFSSNDNHVREREGGGPVKNERSALGRPHMGLIPPYFSSFILPDRIMVAFGDFPSRDFLFLSQAEQPASVCNGFLGGKNEPFMKTGGR